MSERTILAKSRKEDEMLMNELSKMENLIKEFEARNAESFVDVEEKLSFERALFEEKSKKVFVSSF